MGLEWTGLEWTGLDKLKGAGLDGRPVVFIMLTNIAREREMV